MALDTYANLQLAIANWLGATGDTEVSGNAADFVALAEQRINFGVEEGPFPSPALRVRAMITGAGLTYTLTGEYTDLPTGFLAPVRLVYPSSPPAIIQIVSPEQLVELFGANSGTSYFGAVVGTKLQIKPVPAAVATELLYYKAFDALAAAAAGTNWLLANAPAVYLYAALLEATQIGLDDAAASTRWHGLYLGAISGLVKSEGKARWAGTLQARATGPTP